MNNINAIYIDDLEIDDFIDDFDDVLILDSNIITGNPFNSNTNYKNNHISILNSSKFNISFQIIYTLNTQNIDLNSGEFSPLYTRQISFPQNATFLYLTINSINATKKEKVIYHSTLAVNKNYSFTISGTLNDPIISSN